MIDSMHSINRVKRARDHAARMPGRRAARLYIDCCQWLGTWGPTLRGNPLGL